MERQLTPQEEKFIGRFSTLDNKARRKEVSYTINNQRSKSSRRFLITIGVLIFLPFLFSAVFLFQLAKLNDSAGVKQLKYLQTTLPSDSYQTIEKRTGLGNDGNINQIYDERYALVLGIFAFFIIIAAAVVLFYLLRINHRRRKNVEKL